jgi:phospholipase C
MRFMVKILLLSVSFAASLAYAQTNIPQVQHVIVVIQENRTPDNLFGSDAFAQTRQLPGADLVQLGKCGNVEIQLQSLNLGNACDPNHAHNLGWIPTYDSGSMDGACNITATNCTGIEPEYSYAQSSNVVPYFQIAQQYGYGNYMFQTNQGPSFPSHQFLLAGSSAPTNYSDTTLCYDPTTGKSSPCYQWFAAENYSGSLYGCTAPTGTVIQDIDPTGNESSSYNNGFPCYNHNTLATLLDANSLSWKYYTQNGADNLWTAPDAIQGICYPLTGNNDQLCGGYDWTNYVASVFPYSTGYPNSFSPVLTDLGADPNQPQCTLPAVSWVIPDGSWSDHAGEDPDGAGPAWVAAIVNAVGGVYYDINRVKHNTPCSYWNNTVVLVTWDDWGGWYDHVLPWRCNNAGVCSGYPGGADGGGSEYVYGFRVPLVVVSAYNYRPQGSSGYISGACGQPGQPTCPNEQQKYIHDFGSVLNFIEYAFGTGGVPLSLPGFPGQGISPSYKYADYFAPDGPVVCVDNCPHPYSLSDFFNFGGSASTFTPFTQGVNYPTQCFITPTAQGCFGPSFTPTDPDDDAVD